MYNLSNILSEKSAFNNPYFHLWCKEIQIYEKDEVLVRAKTLDLQPSNETLEDKMPQANFHDENEVANETLRTTQRPSRKNGVHSKKSSLKNR